MLDVMETRDHATNRTMTKVMRNTRMVMERVTDTTMATLKGVVINPTLPMVDEAVGALGGVAVAVACPEEAEVALVVTMTEV